MCSPALGSTGRRAEARNLTLGAGSSGRTSEHRPRPMSAGRDGRSEDLTSGPAPPCPERGKPESCPAHLVPGSDCHPVAVGVEQVKSAWGLRPTKRARQRTGALTETFHQLTVSFKLWMTGSVWWVTTSTVFFFKKPAVRSWCIPCSPLRSTSF